MSALPKEPKLTLTDLNAFLGMRLNEVVRSQKEMDGDLAKLSSYIKDLQARAAELNKLAAVLLYLNKHSIFIPDDVDQDSLDSLVLCLPPDAREFYSIDFNIVDYSDPSVAVLHPKAV